MADTAADDGALENLLAAERRQLLEALLAELSTVQADALRLRFFGGLKFQEIADSMGCSLCTAKNRVRWGLLHLSELVQRNSAGQSSADQGPKRTDQTCRDSAGSAKSKANPQEWQR